MALSGILSGTFVQYVTQTVPTNNTDMVLAALGFQYEVIGLKITTVAGGAGQTITLSQTSVGSGINIATGTSVVNAVTWIPVTSSGNAQIPATVPIALDVGANARIEFVEIVCAGRPGITPPTPFTGVENLTIT